MFNFFIYLLSFVVSSIVIITAPDDIIKNYLSVYTISSFIFSLIFFVFFVNYVTVLSLKIIFISLFVLTIFVGALIDPYIVAIIIYPGILIFSDYVATQTSSIKVVNVYRFLLLFTSAPFFIYPDKFQENIIIRTTLIFTITAVLIARNDSVHRLSVKSPAKYLLNNYLFYNGVLLALTYTAGESVSLKMWFISTQAGLVLILKYLDFSLRKSYSSHGRIKYSVAACSLFAPAPCMFLYPSVANIALYFIGYFGLLNASRYISR